MSAEEQVFVPAYDAPKQEPRSKRPGSQSSSMSTVQPSLPPLDLPPALDFDVDDFCRTYQSSDTLEKALLRPQHSNFITNISVVSFHRRDTTFSQGDFRAPAEPPTAILPRKRYSRLTRYLRYTLLTVYRRVFTLIFLLNLVPLFYVIHQDVVSLDTLATAASTNILVAILLRQDFVINAIFRTAWLVPWSVPLRARRWIARCYCYGGIHSGAAIAGTAWWVSFSVMSTSQMLEDDVYHMPLLVSTWTILGMLTVMVVLALPSLRKRHHNMFELTHRFLGWTAVLLFWMQLFLLTNRAAIDGASFLSNLVHTPPFWNLSCITILILHPWLRLRTWTFYPTVLSSHAVRLHFTNHVHKFSCLSLSTSPLREWHPFATFPSSSATGAKNAVDEVGATSLIVSDAGDWTRSLIHAAQALSHHHRTLKKEGSPKMTLWVKSAPIPGVLSLTTLFPRVLLLTTGSGIGPCLSSLLERPPSQFIRLVWSTRSPLATYGPDLLALVYKADPDAMVIDTDVVGRPDLVKVGYALWRDLRAEAVFVLSNEGVTKRVVGGLEGRGVPAFGPIFDS